jgi:peptidoglycan/LPS O-acetylase OafA/YrhL
MTPLQILETSAAKANRHHHSTMKYRPEIDGLRAIAVVAVILFHAGFEPFAGGFVGVDVFFVISGYLITGIILAEMERGTFSLLNFYERRARRILPALFLVMLFTCIGAWLWLPPADMQDFAKSLISTSYFSSNILFWLETGYWGTVNELKPLLHTWTLAIEAQFYLIFPLYLMGMRRFPKRWSLGFFLGLTGISFAIAQWGAYHLPSANFFLLPSRFWELALGAIIAFSVTDGKNQSTSTCFVPAKTSFSIISQKLLPDQSGDPSIRSGAIRHCLFRQVRGSQSLENELWSWLGLGMIGYAIFGFDGTVPSPSVYTLIPTLGTGLLMVAAPGTLVGRLLGTHLLVSLGLISYSAYLWHYPLFVFARHRSLTAPSALLMATLAVLSLLLAYLSWQYIEAPFRQRHLISRKTIFLVWLASSIAFIELGVAGQLTDGFAARNLRRHGPQMAMAQLLSPGVVDRLTLNPVDQLFTQDSIDQLPLAAAENQEKYQYIREINYGFGLGKTCDGISALDPACRTSPEPEILVWGDSFAMQIVPGILASNPDAKIIQLTKSVCGPFFDIAPISEPDYPVRWSRECLEFTEEVRSWLRNNPSIKYAALSSPFSHYLLEDEKVLRRDGEIVQANVELALREFERTLSELKSLGIKPVVFSPPPANDVDLGRCLARAEWMGLALDQCNFREDKMSFKRLQVYQFLDLIRANHQVLSLNQLICQDSLCKAHLGNVWIYRDARHLTDEGAAMLGKQYDFYRIITGPYSPE